MYIQSQYINLMYYIIIMIKYDCFYCIFDQINADFIQKHKKI